MKISLRLLIELLSGEITHEEFLDLQGLDKTTNPFKVHLDEGRLPKEISIETTESDDDRVVFKFWEVDAAISPFKAPRQQK